MKVMRENKVPNFIKDLNNHSYPRQEVPVRGDSKWDAAIKVKNKSEIVSNLIKKYVIVSRKHTALGFHSPRFVLIVDTLKEARRIVDDHNKRNTVSTLYEYCSVKYQGNEK